MLKVTNTIEEILQNDFDCPKPFRKNPKVTSVQVDGTKEYDYLTKKGNEAYAKLVDVIYALYNIGVLNESPNRIIDKLDEIVDREEV